MSKLHDQWVSMAIADDSLVAHQLLLLRCHHLSSVNPWTCRQRRTTRLPAAAARASPTNSLDGFEGSTRPIAPMRSSEPKVHLLLRLLLCFHYFYGYRRVSRFSLSFLLLSLPIKQNNRHWHLFIFTIIPSPFRSGLLLPPETSTVNSVLFSRFFVAIKCEWPFCPFPFSRFLTIRLFTERGSGIWFHSIN